MGKCCAAATLLGLVLRVAKRREGLGTEHWLSAEGVRAALGAVPANPEACALAAKARLQLDHAVRQRLRLLARDKNARGVRLAYAAALYREVALARTAPDAALAAQHLATRIAARNAPGKLERLLDERPELREEILSLPQVESDTLKEEAQMLWCIVRVYLRCMLVVRKPEALGLPLTDALRMTPPGRGLGVPAGLPRTAEEARAELQAIALHLPLPPDCSTAFLIAFVASVLAARLPALPHTGASSQESRVPKVDAALFVYAEAHAHLPRSHSAS